MFFWQSTRTVTGSTNILKPRLKSDTQCTVFLFQDLCTTCFLCLLVLHTFLTPMHSSRCLPDTGQHQAYILNADWSISNPSAPVHTTSSLQREAKKYRKELKSHDQPFLLTSLCFKQRPVHEKPFKDKQWGLYTVLVHYFVSASNWASSAQPSH